MLSAMKTGSVLVDVAIDQGGCFETSHATTHSEPTYVVDGIVHYCVANMPGAVAGTPPTRSTMPPCTTACNSPTRASRPFSTTIICANGLNVHKGRITNRAVADALGYEMAEPKAALAA